jgi:AcrR family transcriptional regulator
MAAELAADPSLPRLTPLRTLPTLLTGQSLAAIPPASPAFRHRILSVSTAPPAPVPAPRQRRKEERPQALLDAALDLFVEKGFAATRSEEVAARAGVSKGTLYLYFPSKEELLKAVIRERLLSQIMAGAARAQAFSGSAADLLRDVLTQWWQDVYDSAASGVFKLIITEVRNFPDIADFYAREVIEPGKALIGRIVQQGIDTGEFHADADVPSTVYSLVFPMVMLCLHKHSVGACAPHQDLDPERFIRSHIQLVVAGLQAPAVHRRR